ncbi:unnamed protein product [Phaeothamnion confervicola]
MSADSPDGGRRRRLTSQHEGRMLADMASRLALFDAVKAAANLEDRRHLTSQRGASPLTNVNARLALFDRVKAAALDERRRLTAGDASAAALADAEAAAIHSEDDADESLEESVDAHVAVFGRVKAAADALSSRLAVFESVKAAAAAVSDRLAIFDRVKAAAATNLHYDPSYHPSAWWSADDGDGESNTAAGPRRFSFALGGKRGAAVAASVSSDSREPFVPEKAAMMAAAAAGGESDGSSSGSGDSAASADGIAPVEDFLQFEVEMAEEAFFQELSAEAPAYQTDSFDTSSSTQDAGVFRLAAQAEAAMFDGAMATAVAAPPQWPLRPPSPAAHAYASVSSADENADEGLSASPMADWSQSRTSSAGYSSSDADTGATAEDEWEARQSAQQWVRLPRSAPLSEAALVVGKWSDLLPSAKATDAVIGRRGATTPAVAAVPGDGDGFMEDSGVRFEVLAAAAALVAGVPMSSSSRSSFGSRDAFSSDVPTQTLDEFVAAAR